MLYAGKLSNGYFEGRGNLFSFEDLGQYPVYSGHFEGGLPHGRGAVLYDTGRVAWEGACRKGVLTHGRLFSRDGRMIYDGPFDHST